MKVWEKIAQIYNGQMQLFIDKCPSAIEQRHHIIGEKRFRKHCNIGCGVECTKEYLELDIKK